METTGIAGGKRLTDEPHTGAEASRDPICEWEPSFPQYWLRLTSELTGNDSYHSGLPYRHDDRHLSCWYFTSSYDGIVGTQADGRHAHLRGYHDILADVVDECIKYLYARNKSSQMDVYYLPSP